MGRHRSSLRDLGWGVSNSPNPWKQGSAKRVVRTKDGAHDLDAEGKAPIFAPGSGRRELAAIPAEAGLPAGTRYHSILVETGGKVKRHREFVVFHSERIYPEYLVAFHRLP